MPHTAWAPGQRRARACSARRAPGALSASAAAPMRRSVSRALSSAATSSAAWPPVQRTAAACRDTAQAFADYVIRCHID